MRTDYYSPLIPCAAHVTTLPPYAAGAWIHKWSSLVCTVFMLLLCLTGLPLIYHHEIGHLLGNESRRPPAGRLAPPRAKPGHRDRRRQGPVSRQDA
jgi:hypothetical protein